MYTSCPECGTVFRISTSDLRVAEGYVRCGHCSATFNAIATLTDEPPPTVTLQQLVLPTEPGPGASWARAAQPTPPEPEPEPMPGFPEEPQAPAAPPELEAAATYVPLPVSDDTLEFDIPEDSWSNFFETSAPPTAAPVAAVLAATAEAETAAPEQPEPEAPAAAEAEWLVEPAVETEARTPSEAAPVPEPEPEPEPEPQPEPEPELEAYLEPADDAEAATPEPATPAPDVGAGIGSDTVDQAGLYKALAAESGLNLDDDADWQALLEEVRDDDAPPEPVYVIGEEENQSPPGDLPLPEVSWDELATEDTRAPAPLPADFVPDLSRPGLAVAAAGAAAEPEPELTARREPSIADRPFIWEPPAPPPPETGRHWGYTAGSVLAALLLVMQLLHLQRDELATHPSLTEPLRRTYAALGMPLWPAWDLRSYEMRNSEAVADRSSPGALDILGRIAVVGTDRVGLPLVRVTLRDRFGESLGSRVFEPAEYLGRNAQLREPVSPGTLIPVEISLKDPGRDAQGFDVDVCVMSRRDGISCRSEREPFAR